MSAIKAGISDAELCEVVEELNCSLWDADLGSDVYKKRLNKNMHRSILLHKVVEYWIFSYLFAKADRENIAQDELKAFKKLSNDYKKLTGDQLAVLVKSRNLLEICYEC